jgi:transcriptional regulator with XRE-family HTH domain
MSKRPDPRDAAIGRRLRVLRAAEGITEADLAARMGTSQPQIDRLEKGLVRWTATWIYRASEALDVRSHRLLEDAPLFTRQEEALVDRYRALSEERRDIAFDFVDHLATRNQPKKTGT